MSVRSRAPPPKEAQPSLFDHPADRHLLHIDHSFRSPSLQQASRQIPTAAAPTDLPNVEQIVLFDNELRNLRFIMPSGDSSMSFEVGSPGVPDFSNNTRKVIHRGTLEVLQVKVPDCKEDWETGSKEFDEKLENYESDDVKRIYLFMKTYAKDEKYFDGMSGLSLEHDEYFKDNNVLFFGWNRTITQCQGFLYTDTGEDSFEGYLKHLKGQKREATKDTEAAVPFSENIEDHAKALCGGSVRHARLKEMFSKISDPERVYIISKSRFASIIFEMMKTIMPEMKKENVLCTRSTTAERWYKYDQYKMEVIKNLLDRKQLTPKPKDELKDGLKAESSCVLS